MYIPLSLVFLILFVAALVQKNKDNGIKGIPGPCPCGCGETVYDPISDSDNDSLE